MPLIVFNSVVLTVVISPPAFAITLNVPVATLIVLDFSLLPTDTFTVITVVPSTFAAAVPLLSISIISLFDDEKLIFALSVISRPNWSKTLAAE